MGHVNLTQMFNEQFITLRYQQRSLLAAIFALVLFYNYSASQLRTIHSCRDVAFTCSTLFVVVYVIQMRTAITQYLLLA
ncbi:MAG: hypothetical protein KME46_08360 [Brasilonema angustatum HA4187-MV1]|nr:hypothetical protein [Brasilonema angustatum HA4187-MV1]